MMSLLVWFLAFVNGWTALPTPQAPPVPVRVVTMGVELPSGTKATLSVPSGGRAIVQAVDGPRLGLVPTLTEDGRVDLAVIEITTDSPGVESTRELDRRFLELGERVRFDFAWSWIAVTWQDVYTRTVPEGADGAAPCRTCCVLCGGEWHCACRVVTPCGDCCCPTACDCGVVATTSGCCAGGAVRQRSHATLALRVGLLGPNPLDVE
jgi:hypothetical protein